MLLRVDGGERDGPHLVASRQEGEGQGDRQCGRYDVRRGPAQHQHAKRSVGRDDAYRRRQLEQGTQDPVDDDSAANAGEGAENRQGEVGAHRERQRQEQHHEQIGPGRAEAHGLGDRLGEGAAQPGQEQRRAERRKAARLDGAPYRQRTALRLVAHQEPRETGLGAERGDRHQDQEDRSRGEEETGVRRRVAAGHRDDHPEACATGHDRADHAERSSSSDQIQLALDLA